MSNKYTAALSRLFEESDFPDGAFYIDKAFDKKKIIIYGAGESFHYYKEIIMRGYGYVPSAIMDRKFRPGDVFDGIFAFSPVDYRPAEEERDNAVVIICLGKQTYYEQVVRDLRNMGFCNIISLNDIYEIHNPFCSPAELMQNGFSYFQSRREEIESCYELFADDMSREIYLGCLETHMRRIPVSLPMRPRHEQYVPGDIRLSRGYSRFLYCGVSVGEMKSVLGQTGKIDELVCFEPDPNQYKLTAQYLYTHHSEIAKRVTALPCAVYSHEEVKPFVYSDTSFGSRVTETSDYYVQCVSIDNILPGFCPTFINMDIEGAEPYALKGAENTIKHNMPDLAVCVYHSPCHIWEIPLYLNGLDLGYRFYLRNYTSFTGETVLYAVH